MNRTSRIGASLAVLALLAGALPVHAEDAVGVRTAVKAELKASTTKKAEVKAEVQAKVSVKMKERATQEIDRRTKALVELKARVSEMKRLNAEQKAAINASLDAQIAELATLKAKIAAETDNETLKTLLKSITSSYRIFALVMPQVQIVAAADRIINAADIVLSLAAKLQVRLDAAKTAGKDVAAELSTLANVTAKANLAKTDAAAAVDLTASLTPDGGDKAKMEANKKALMDGRAKIKSAHDNLQAARKDAVSITSGLKKLLGGVKASSTINASTTVSQ